jgi:hypothetical protein
MIVGATLFKLDGNPYYTIPFRKSGDAATFEVVVSHVSGSATLDVDIEHRALSDTTYAVAASFSTIAATGVHPKDATGLKEVVRLKFTVGGPSATAAVHLFAPNPAWRPNA